MSFCPKDPVGEFISDSCIETLSKGLLRRNEPVLTAGQDPGGKLSYVNLIFQRSLSP